MYVVTQPQPISLIARQVGNEFAPFTIGSISFQIAEIGTLSPEQMLTKAYQENRKLIWNARFYYGTLLLLPILLLISPVLARIDFSPFLGRLTPYGSYRGMLLGAILISTVFAGFIWAYFQPLWATFFVFSAMLCVFLLQPWAAAAVRKKLPASGVSSLFLAALLLLSFVFAAETPILGRAGGGEDYSDSASDYSSDYSSSESSYSSEDSYSSYSSDSSDYSSSSDSSGYDSSEGGSGVETSVTRRTFPTGRPDTSELDNFENDQKNAEIDEFAGYGVRGVPEDKYVAQALMFACFSTVFFGFLASRCPYRKKPTASAAGNNAEATRVPWPWPDKNALQNLISRDPAFNETAFLDRIKTAFSIIQAAWSDQELKKAQAFLSDAVFERFSLQIDQMKHDGIRDVMEDLDVLEARVAGFDSDSHFDTVHVFVRASAVNYRSSLNTGAFIEGSKSPEEFSEVWSFIRRLEAQTSQKPGLIEGSCPNCGAPIEPARAANCKACSAFLRSGEYDWVLAEITQTRKWKSKNPETIPGLADMQEADPGFNIQHIEDRTSTIFWRGIACYRHGNLEPLKKCSTPNYLAEFEKKISINPEGSRCSLKNAAVGSVEVLMIAVGNPLDQVFVNICWSGRESRICKSGTETVAETSTSFDEVFVLKRKSGIRTDLRRSLSSALCPGCGARETSPTDHACPYCGTVFNDLSSDWLIDQVTHVGAKSYQTLFSRLTKQMKTGDRKKHSSSPQT